MKREIYHLQEALNKEKRKRIVMRKGNGDRQCLLKVHFKKSQILHKGKFIHPRTTERLHSR